MNTSLALITVVGLVVVAALVFVYVRMRSKDVLEDIVRKRSANARIAHVATFMEGIEEIPVAVALDDRSLYYENADLQAHLDLKLIDEVEYDDELSTARSVHNAKVLRLRSHGHTFEFTIDNAHAPQWMAALPPRTMGGPQRQAV